MAIMTGLMPKGLKPRKPKRTSKPPKPPQTKALVKSPQAMLNKLIKDMK